MDARRALAKAIYQEFEAAAYDDDGRIIATLSKLGFTILHDSQNHGPTVERAAGYHDDQVAQHEAAIVDDDPGGNHWHSSQSRRHQADAAAIRQLKEDRGC